MSAVPTTRPLVIGHRGAAGHEVENTRSAFLRGIALGADGVECDVRTTLDGKLVIFHDESLLRLAGLPERLNRLTLAEIQKRVRLGDSDETILTLEELCEIPEVDASWLFIELKEPRIEAEVIRIVQKYRDPTRTVVGSFNLETVKNLVAAGYPLPLLLSEKFDGLCPSTPVAYASLDFSAIDPLRVAELHRQKTKVWAWTVNESDEIQRVISCKVDGVISDYPDRVLRELDRLTRPLA